MESFPFVRLWSAYTPLFSMLRRIVCLLIALVPLTANAQVSTISVQSSPWATAVNPATNRIYVANRNGGSVSVIDGLTNAVVATVAVGTTPNALAVNVVTNKIYVANQAGNSVSVIDGATNAASAPISVGTAPDALAVNNVTNKVYVTNKGSNDVTVIDGSSNTVTKTITVQGGPYGLAINPITNKIYTINNTGNSVSVIDGSADTVAATVSVSPGSSPDGIAVNPITNKIYVANSQSTAGITVIDGLTNATTNISGAAFSNCRGVAVNPATNMIYVTNTTTVAVIDAANGNAISTTPVLGSQLWGIAINSVTNRIYVPDQGGNTIKVIDGSNPTVSPASVTVGSGPYGASINTVTGKIYVPNSSSGTVSVIDGFPNTLNTITTGTSPYWLVLNSVTNKLYTSNYQAQSVTVIDGTTSATSSVSVGIQPFGMAANPVTNTVYVANYGSNTVSVINGANAVTATLPVGNRPLGVVVNPVTNKIYVPNNGSNTISVIDGATNSVTATLPAGTGPYWGAVNLATNKIYVTNTGGTVTVIDGATNTTSSVTVGSNPQYLAVNPITNRIYIVNGNSNTVTVIDGATNATTTVAVNPRPFQAAVNIVTNKIYVTSQTTSNITVIDGTTNATTSVPIGGTSYGVTVNPNQNRIYTSSVAGGNRVTVIDGASNAVAFITVPGAPSTIVANPITGNVYTQNASSSTVAAINAYVPQTMTWNTVVSGVNDAQTLPSPNVFTTYNRQPTFNIGVQSNHSGAVVQPPITQLYYEVDGANPSNRASQTTPGNPSMFSITLPTQQTGLHALYVYAAYGNEGGHNSQVANNAGSSNGNSPELGNLAAYVFLIVPIQTTTSVTSNQSPQASGTNVVFTATVTPAVSGGSTPSGSISFYDGTALLGTGSVTESSGTYTASFTTNTLSVGSHTINATYSGDSNYVSSSGTMTQIIAGPPASIVVNGGNNQTGVYGTAFVQPLLVTVKDSNGQPVPGASVAFSGTNLGFAPLTATTNASGQAQAIATPIVSGSLVASAGVTGVGMSATFNLTANKAVLSVTASSDTRQFGAANPTLTAVITGFVNEDTLDVVSGQPSITTTATTQSPVGDYPTTPALGNLSAANYSFTFVAGTLHVVQIDTSSVLLTISPTTVMYGAVATLMAVVTPAGATGLVRFSEGVSNLLGSASVDNTGTAVFPVSTLDAGTHSITANYQGDQNVPASTSNTAQLTVTKRTAPGGGPSLTITVNDATRTSTQANPPFTYSVSGTLVNGDTYATAITGTPGYSTTGGTAPGTFAVNVNGLNSPNYTFTVVPGTLTVVETQTATTLAISATSTQYGDPVTLTAAVAPSGATGTVSFFDGIVLLGQSNVSNGLATFTTSGLNTAGHSITAVYNGDGIYAASQSQPTTVTVSEKTGPNGEGWLTVTVVDETRMFGKANPQFVYVVSGPLLNGDTYGQAVEGSPIYSTVATLTSTAGSTWPVNVSGIGSPNYKLTFVPGILTVAPSSSTTTLTISSTATQYGDPLTLTSTVAPSPSSGSVVFQEGTTVLGNAIISGGIAVLTTTALNTGTHIVTATYLGDTNYGESVSGPVAVAVSPKVGPGGGPTLIATVGNATRQYRQGNPAFTYAVTGTLLNNDIYATAVTGVPVYSTTATLTSSPGTYPISVAGLNSANYLLATVQGTLVITKATSTVALSSSLNPSTFGATVTFTATLPADSTGTVSFYDASTAIGTGTISNGKSTFAISSLTQGTHAITAVYGGDSNYLTASSTVLSEVVAAPPIVADFALANRTGPQIIPPGASASFTIELSSVNAAFNNPVSLTATNLPPGASYSYSPVIITPGSLGGTSTLTVTVPALSSVSRDKSETLILTAFLVIPAALIRRTRFRKKYLSPWILVAVCILGTIVGCGTGGYFNQPQQTYNITLTGSSGNLVHTTSAILTVQ